MISIIIPALNEASRLPHLLRSLRAEAVPSELIVVDGGSEDRSIEIANAVVGVRVLRGERGRGRQLALGAAHAVGDVLLFLHADSVFPCGGLDAIERLMREQPQIGGGNFRLVFDGEDEFSRWLTNFYAWLRRHGIYYGDSGIFVRRATYDVIDGIRPLAVMEDFDLVRRLERAALTTCIANPALITSSRRFIGRHPVAIVLGWLWIHLLYAVGMAPERLAKIYDSERQG
jgi:rSAM/selenodomain-associated transferase 2